MKSPLPAAFVDDVVAIVSVHGCDDRALVVAAAVALRGVHRGKLGGRRPENDPARIVNANIVTPGT